jgi:hypothetical protein
MCQSSTVRFNASSPSPNATTIDFMSPFTAPEARNREALTDGKSS